MIATKELIPRDAYLSWLEVDLDAVRTNYRLIRQQLRSGAALFGVVKADAYGHGAIEVARVLASEGAPMLCVARIEEAVELRAAGITTPLLVLAPPLGPQAELVMKYDCSVVVCDHVHLAALAAAAASSGRSARVHLKLDIGMGRLGVQPHNVTAFLQQLRHCPTIQLEGLMSHFPCADMEPAELTEKQAELFGSILGLIREAEFTPRYVHTANTAAILDHPAAQFNATRSGIGLYGQYPSPEMEHRLPLIPAMAMRTTITFLKDVPAETGLSYGLTYMTNRPSRIATVPLGYADGYPRHASSRTEMLLHNQRVPQVGRVCMDHVLLDVTDVPSASIGDTVTAFGTTDGQLISAEELGSRCGTIGYEITTRVGKRLPKFYTGR